MPKFTQRVLQRVRRHPTPKRPQERNEGLQRTKQEPKRIAAEQYWDEVERARSCNEVRSNKNHRDSTVTASVERHTKHYDNA